ncbi:thermonuclease family protein [Nitrospinae bacterium AH_259_B05_G02_I21]|nr:thermonuclease family protein [Nitrospinae bacterium AH_259_B05_G02_I21]MDA2932440.1 thermonuclease family protein [Nitrospinae bacterium AH-259-F20]
MRLIGADTPELHHPRRGREPYGREAKACLVSILNGQKVRLKIGADPRDRYGRTLAHLWTEKGVHVNKELLRRGCGRLMVIGANTGHLSELVAAQEEARAAKRGLWGLRP